MPSCHYRQALEMPSFPQLESSGTLITRKAAPPNVCCDNAIKLTCRRPVYQGTPLSSPTGCQLVGSCLNETHPITLPPVPGRVMAHWVALWPYSGCGFISHPQLACGVCKFSSCSGGFPPGIQVSYRQYKNTSVCLISPIMCDMCTCVPCD